MSELRREDVAEAIHAAHEYLEAAASELRKVVSIEGSTQDDPEEPLGLKLAAARSTGGVQQMLRMIELILTDPSTRNFLKKYPAKENV